IVVSNSGPSTVSGATVSDLFPGVFTTDTYTSTVSGAASGNTASGSGNIADTVTLASGSTITYVVTGTVAPTATGSLSNTATVSASSGFTDGNTANNSST